MAAKQNYIDPDWDRLEEEDTNEPAFKDVLKRTLKHWPWLVLSVVICVGLGILFILRSPVTYTENAQVVIKNDEEGSSSVAGSFSDLGIFSRNSNVLNEIATMSSPDVMADVVKMLDLTVNYSKPGLFHDIALYASSLPVTVSFPNSDDEESMKFKIEIAKNGNYTISKLKRKGFSGKWEKSKKTYSGKLGSPLKTEFGTIDVIPTENYRQNENYEIIVDKAPLSSTINRYTNALKATLDDEDSTVIDLSISDQNRERADQILAAVIAVYNENWIMEKNQQAVSTSNFINERLGVIENELGDVDSDISQYKTENLVPDVATMTASYIKEKEEISKMLLELESQLQAARILRSKLIAEGNQGNALPANTLIDNPSLQTQITLYNELLLKKNALLTKSSEKNPVVQSLDEEISLLRSAILSSVDNVILGLEGQKQALQTAKGSTTGHLATSPKQAKYLLSVERQQKVKENLYLFLLQRREDNELNQAFSAYNTRIIKRPGGDGRPTSPKKGLILAFSFLVGLIIPFGYNYCFVMWDTKLRGRKDLEGVKTPMIGEIPIDKKIAKRTKKTDSRELVVKSGSRDIINEAFRVLRTNIEFTKINKDGCNVLVMTSFNPGSGKSFITMNLAASLGLKGKKVLVIDGDFRRGSTSGYINNPRKGLADYLAGYNKDLESLIISYPEVENVSVFPIGKLPPNPTELIETSAFGEMIDELRKHYDYILIDCPPIEVVADAQILDIFADRTIFILRTGLMERSLLKELDKFYAEKKYHHLAFILNGTARAYIAYGNSGKYAYGE